MIKFLARNRFLIIFLLLSSIFLFWITPVQKKLYLTEDYELLEKRAFNFIIWFLGIGIAVLLFFLLRTVKNFKQAGNVLLLVFSAAIGLFFMLNALMLPIFLLINRIDLGAQVEKKYTVSHFVTPGKPETLLHDLRTNRIVRDKNVKNIKKLDTLKPGDTVIVTFNKGLLGVGFDPEIR